MKKLIVLLASILLFGACKFREKPDFIRVDRIDLGKVTLQEITFEADAVFANKNNIGGKLVTDNIDVYVDDVLVGNLKTKEFYVPAKDTFTIPLQGKLAADKILKKDGNSILSNILSIISSKKIEVRLEGDIVFKKGPFSYTYSINKTSKVDIKL